MGKSSERRKVYSDFAVHREDMENSYEVLEVKLYGVCGTEIKYMSADSFRKGIDYLIAKKRIDRFTKLLLINGEGEAANPEIEDIVFLAEKREIFYAVTTQEQEHGCAVYDYRWRRESDGKPKNRYLGMPVVYADFGDGFEKAVGTEKCEFSFEEEYFQAEYEFEKPPVKLKIMPSGRQYCVLNDFMILTEYGKPEKISHNGVEIDGLLCFDVYRAEIVCENPEGAKQFRIKGEITFFRSFLEYSMIDKMRNLSKNLSETKQELAEARKLNEKAVSQKTEKAVPVKTFSSKELLENWDKYYRYSMLIQKVFPDKSEKERDIAAYMDMKYYSLVSDCRYRPQEVLVSVIMPTYNRADVIEGAIDSVLNQTYRNLELIIVDDGSTDDTERVVKGYEDSRIRFIANHRQKGVSGARNSGLEIAEGELVAYLDTDNTWDVNYLLLMVNAMLSRPEVNAAYSAQDIYNYNTDTHKEEFQYIRFAVYNHSLLKNRNYIDLNCYMHKRALYKELGGFSEELQRLVDWELIYRYAQKGYPYALPCRISNYYFERSAVQITSRKPGTYQAFLDKFDSMVKGEPLGLETEKYLDINGYELYSDRLPEKYACGKRKVSVVIPSYEALQCLIVCIEAVHKYTADMDYEIIIVDNNSSAIVKEYLEKLKETDPKVKVVFNNYNMGFTYAVNQGIEISQEGSDIVLLNNDAIVTEGWIEELYRVKDEIGTAGLIVPRQVLLPRTKTMDIHVPQSVASRELDVTLSVHHDNVKDVDKYRKYGFVQVSFAPFFLVMITRECYNRLGLLDEKNGRHYKSDRLYCAKATENAFDIVYTPYSKAYHLLQQSTQALKKTDEKMFRAIFLKNEWSDIGYENVRRDK